MRKQWQTTIFTEIKPKISFPKLPTIAFVISDLHKNNEACSFLDPELCLKLVLQ
jgi:hypothetical protein